MTRDNFSKKEKRRLEKSANNYHLEGFNKVLTKFCFQTLRKFFKGKSCLELGCGYGDGTRYLLDYFDKVVALDGSKIMIDRFVKRFKQSKKLEVVCSLMEDYKTTEKFDTIVLVHMLEHVADPVRNLKRAKKWLKNNGVILIDVPNANALNRLAGVKMCLLKKITELHEDDLKLGHRRVYTKKTLMQDIKEAGLKVKKTGGIFLKPLSNRQIEENWSSQTIKAFYKLGKDFPDLCSEIYAVCTL